MADSKPSNKVPPTPSTKTVQKESLQNGMRANSTGGDVYDRYRGQYSKNPPQRDTDTFEY